MRNMKDAEIKIGKTYKIIIAGNRVVCRVIGGDKNRGYRVLNLATGRKALASSASRFHGEIVPTGNVIWKGCTAAKSEPAKPEQRKIAPLKVYDIVRDEHGSNGSGKFIVRENGEPVDSFGSALKAHLFIQDRTIFRGGQR